MAKNASVIRFLSRRPIDCSFAVLNSFVDIALAAGEVPLANLKRGVPMAEMLFFAIDEEKKPIGVGAIRYSNSAYHKHLFEKAGVPEMYNPQSVESCWIAVKPEYRGKGIWKGLRKSRLDFLGNRPCHSIRRVENKLTGGHQEWTLAGQEFYSKTSPHKLKLLVYNHDPVFDANKRLNYS